MKKIRLTESQLHNVIRKCVNEAIKGMRSKRINEAQYGVAGEPWVLIAELREGEDDDIIDEILDHQDDVVYIDNLCAQFTPEPDSEPIEEPWSLPHGGVLLDNDRYIILYDNQGGQVVYSVYAPYYEYFD